MRMKHPEGGLKGYITQEDIDAANEHNLKFQDYGNYLRAKQINNSPTDRYLEYERNKPKNPLF